MSKQSTAKIQQQASGKAFCIFCKNLELDEKVYTSHNCRAPNGKVICPNLLDTTCKNCLRKGHTRSHCTKVPQPKEEKPFKPEQSKEPVVFKLSQLDNKEEFPELPKKYSVVAKFKPFLKIEVDDYEEDTMQTIQEKLAELKKKEQAKEEQLEKEESNPRPKKDWKQVVNWCDWESSDEDEDEDHYEAENYYEDDEY